MRAPKLGTLYCEPGYGCDRCGKAVEVNVLDTFAHDLRCWGWRTAFYNLRIRLCPPDWFA